MSRIRSLRPNVTREEAIATLGGGIPGRLRQWSDGALRSVAEVYVPFHLFDATISRRGGHEQRSFFAIDAVVGTLDLYQFDEAPEGSALVEVETRNCPAALLEEARGASILENRLRRGVFQTGFFRVRDLRFLVKRVPLDLHVPYWLGFFGRGEAARLVALDAVRRRLEGAKARALFEGWLAA
jgi:hypothetical protein